MATERWSSITKVCGNCGKLFPIWIVLDGKRHSFTKRVNCHICHPLGTKERVSYNYKTGKKPANTFCDFLLDDKQDLNYLLGFICADGCLIRNGRQIVLVQKNKEFLLAIKKRFGITANEVCERKDRQAWVLTISSRDLWRWLEQRGLMPNKSKILGKVVIDKGCEGSFLRGVFDGDGCVCRGKVTIKHKEYSLWKVTFYSASKVFIHFLGELTAHIRRPQIYENKSGVFMLTFCGKYAIPLIAYMYQSEELCLERKKMGCEQLNDYFRK